MKDETIVTLLGILAVFAAALLIKMDGLPGWVGVGIMLTIVGLMLYCAHKDA